MWIKEGDWGLQSPHVHSPAASKPFANPSRDSSCSPFALGPCKDFCIFFSKDLFCSSDLFKGSIWYLFQELRFLSGIYFRDFTRKTQMWESCPGKTFFPRCFCCKSIKATEVWTHGGVPIIKCHHSRFIFWLICPPVPSVYKLKTHIRRVTTPNN